MSKDLGGLTGSRPAGQAPSGLVASRIDPGRVPPFTDESDPITRGDALNAVRDMLIDSARCSDQTRPLVQAYLRLALQGIWATQSTGETK
jgi:hypothetical protein